MENKESKIENNDRKLDWKAPEVELLPIGEKTNAGGDTWIDGALTHS